MLAKQKQILDLISLYKFFLKKFPYLYFCMVHTKKPEPVLSLGTRMRMEE